MKNSYKLNVNNSILIESQKILLRDINHNKEKPLWIVSTRKKTAGQQLDKQVPIAGVPL